jgi:hypothetical protein
VILVSYIDTAKIKTPEHIARCARAYLYGTCLTNMHYAQRGLIPPLYGSGVRFQNEPWAGKGVEEFADALTVIKRGWGDCDDLCAYRVGELWAHGDKSARLRVYWRIIRGRPTFHVELRRAVGTPQEWIEDPARYLGMRGRRAA